LFSWLEPEGAANFIDVDDATGVRVIPIRLTP
jgi:hypothetical protein